ncbi:MAG: DUF3160 domain-containing protein [Candidatus Lokiarchaeota archaeon]|nr:DUF3160 domain-containing protein [Candidatus Lokiarchaeota archaeon]
MSPRGQFEGKSNEFITIVITIIIAVSGVSGALIGSLFRPNQSADSFVDEPFGDPLPIRFESQPFADYEEYETDFTLNVSSYDINSDLSNIINLDSFSYLPENARNAIVDHYFFAVPSNFKMFADIYCMNDDYELPSFVTSDSVLHAYHVLYDLALREIEETHFMNHIGNLSRHMVNVSLDQYNLLESDLWRALAKKNAAFFSVAAKLHDPDWTVPDPVTGWVYQTLHFIENAGGFTTDWFMNQRLDFSQFIPRGHYTRTESLKRFFKTIMWLSRVAFRVQPDDDGLTAEQNAERAENETGQAVLLCRAFEQPSHLFIDGETPLRLWRELYDTTSFFVSTSDDLTVDEYLTIFNAIYDDPVNIVELCNRTKLGTFIATARESRSPQIISGWVWDSQSINVTKGLRFMGQRFVPDSYMFSELTHAAVKYRMMPKALDVMAVLGSQRAWDLLDDQKDYLNYTTQMNRLKETYGDLNLSNWTQSLYWSWLYSFKTLLDEPELGHPSFMLTDQWIDKQLTTCLGTWTELRHDTILYAKQSYSQTYGASYPPPGYVEPVPKFYAKLASLCRMMLQGLDSRGLVVDDFTERLVRLHDLLREFQVISEKELSQTPLNATEWSLLENIGGILAHIEGTYNEGGRAALVADVHTDPMSGKVLEEATGNPMVILVAVPNEEDKVFLARGAMYSHYEFAWPMSERLTDEAWWQMLEEESAPSMDDWMGSFVLGISETSDLSASHNAYNDPEMRRNSSSKAYRNVMPIAIDVRKMAKPT